MAKQMMTGAEAAVATLAAHGVDTIFGIPGGHSLAMYDALGKCSAIRHVLGRHEQGLGYMADGYARASGRVGVATVVSGPAVANIAAALGQATTDTSPVLAIASTVRSELIGKRRGGLHDCGDTLEMVRPVCRYVQRCTKVEDVPPAVADLVHKLTTRRPGGAFCEIPQDVLGAEAKVEIPAPLAVERVAADPGQVRQAVALLAAAERPVLWVGTGATVSGAQEEAVALAEKLGAVVISTVLGRGLVPGDHPNHVFKDGVSLSVVDDVIADADVVLAVGTMFKQEDTSAWQTRLGDRLIHIDIDPDELGRSYAPAVGITADAKAALQAVLAALPDREPAPSEWAARGRQAAAERLAARRKENPVEMRVTDGFRAALPRDGVAVFDRCNLGYWASRCMPSYAPRTFQYPMGYGGLGGALPQAIGAKLACPDRAVVCVIGDGGFQFTAPELIVAVQEQVAVTVLLCNNNAYGAIRAGQDRNFGGRRFGSSLLNPDFGKLAAAYGVPSRRVDTPEALEQALAAALESGQLNMIECTLDLADPP